MKVVKTYKCILDCFGIISGLSINYDKSAIIPLNYSERKTMQLKKSLGCLVELLTIRYLGVPLGANPKKINTWKPILDKIERKLSCWKSSLLSKARRLVIIKAVLNNLSVYYLSLFQMPKTFAKKKIISMHSRFF